MINDLTTGKPLKLIITFSIPFIIGNMLQQFYVLADTAIVGRILGVNALAAVGSTGSLIWGITGLLQGMGLGCSMVTAQQVGAKNETKVRSSFAMSIILLSVMTLIVTLLSYVGAEWMLKITRTPQEHMNDALTYIKIVFAGSFASCAFNLFTYVIRAIGDSRTPLIFLAVACVVNIIGDILLMGVFDTGVGGAAAATIFAQILSAIMCVVYILKKVPRLRLKRNDFKIDKKMITVLFRFGMPMGILNTILSLGVIIMQAVCNMLGTTAMAAYAAGAKITQLYVQPVQAFGSATAVFGAQNYGAGKYDRIKTGVRQGHIVAQAWTIVLALVMVMFGKSFLKVVTGNDSGEIIDYGYKYLVINSALGVILTPLIIYKNILQSLGCAFIPMLSGFIEVVCRAVVAVMLSAGFGFLGVCYADPAAWLGALVPIIINYIFIMRKFSKRNS